MRVPETGGQGSEEKIWARVDTAKIDMLTRLVEAWDHLGVVSTIDRDQGLVLIRCTADTRAELLEILTHLPFSVNIYN